MKSTTKYYDFEIFTSLKIEYSSNCWTSFGKKKYDDFEIFTPLKKEYIKLLESFGNEAIR